MINYSLKCSKDHRFDSWFKSADAYDKLRLAGMVSCAICGSARVEKDLMAPSLGRSRSIEHMHRTPRRAAQAKDDHQLGTDAFRHRVEP